MSTSGPTSIGANTIPALGRTASRFSAGAAPERADEKPGMLDKALRPIAVNFNGAAIQRAGAEGAARIAHIRLLADQAQPLLPPPTGRMPTIDQQNIYLAAAIKAAEQQLGLRPHDSQIEGALAVLSGFIAEMDTGEGKSLVAALGAAVAALSGVPTHVVTVNDYLATRDAEKLAPFFASLGLTVSSVDREMEPEARRAAYQADITYAANKELTFDYLRDRVSAKAEGHPAAMAMVRYVLNDETQQSGRAAAKPMMRGLHFAIVDEADSVLVDEARVPLILSATTDVSDAGGTYQAARAIALQLEAGKDYDLDLPNRSVALRPDREDHVTALAKGTALEKGARRRRLLVVQALAAAHVFELDRDYIIRDDKIVIIDENTGRAMPDRAWDMDLQASIEVKENLPFTAGRETIAQISFQRFFRRYLALGGLTGTAQEVAGEFRTIYRHDVQRIEPNRPNRRATLPPLICTDATAKIEAVIKDVKEMQALGRPVLIGTRTVRASETLAAALGAAGLSPTILNARQDEEEAEIVARAGEAGALTIATNMAGRGTDIALSDAARQAGGLHVILTEFHEAGRIDRQLIGRAARQGDPGSARAIVALDDDVLNRYLPALRTLVLRMGKRGQRSWPILLKYAQRRAERLHGRARLAMLEQDEQLEVVLAAAGKGL